MARGSKASYTDKQKREAEHIEKHYEKSGTSKPEAERRAWATVNKESGGGKQSGSGRKTATKSATKKVAGRKKPVGNTPSKQGSKTTKVRAR